MNKDDTHHGQQQEQGQEEQTFFATWLPRNDMREIAVLMELPIEGLSYARLVAEIRTGCPGPRGAFGILCYRGSILFDKMRKIRDIL
jgi:hypothetical protein